MTPILTEPAIDAIRGEYGGAAVVCHQTCGVRVALSGVAGPHRDRLAAGPPFEPQIVLEGRNAVIE